MKPFSKAVQRYEALIDDLAGDTRRHFGAIGDPNMEGVRFHTFERYLELAGIPEAAVEAHNGAFGQDLIHAEQNNGGDDDAHRA